MKVGDTLTRLTGRAGVVSSARTRSVTAAPWRSLAVAAAVVLVVAPMLANDPYWERQTLLIALWSMPAISVMILVGFSGELFIGQLAIFAIAAFASAHFTATDGWPFFPSVIVATLLAGAAGVVLATPALRLGQWRLAISSLFMVYVIPDLVNSNPWNLTGGAIGLPGVPAASLFGRDLGTQGLETLVVVSLVVVLVLVRNLRRSAWGGCLALVKANGPAAESLGISLLRAKLLVYTMSALVAGYAGAIFPHIDGYLGSGSFPLSQAILLLAAAVIGGVGTLIGPVIGTALLMAIPLVFASFVDYSVIIYGAILIVVTLVLPSGLVPAAAALGRRVAGRSRGGAPARGTLRRPSWAASRRAPDAAVGRSVERRLSLRVDEVTMRFGGLVALDNVRIEARPGQVTAVIGPNGSGKTTLLNVISGYYRPTAGAVAIGQTRIDGRRPHQIAARGLGRTFQVAHLPPDQTVLDITAAGLFRRRKTSLVAGLLRLPRARRDDAAAAATAYNILARIGIADHAEMLGSELSAGQQRLVEIARTLATDSPILLFDEPAAGLVGQELDRLADLVIELKRLGHTLVIVDHHMELVMRVADRVTVLDFGTVIASGRPDDIRDNPAVIRAYLGSAAASATEQRLPASTSRQETSHEEREDQQREKTAP
jgi:branched-chain amino acid transport system permease protein